jgi:hypothetical protein
MASKPYRNGSMHKVTPTMLILALRRKKTRNSPMHKVTPTMLILARTEKKIFRGGHVTL